MTAAVHDPRNPTKFADIYTLMWLEVVHAVGSDCQLFDGFEITVSSGARVLQPISRVVSSL